MHNREHPVGLYHRLVRQLLCPHNRKALQRERGRALRITGGKLPALQDTYTTRCHRKAIQIIKDNNHLSHCLFTHDCLAMYACNSIIKFGDDTTVVGLITNNDETAYREEVRGLGVWCQEITTHSTSTKQRR